MGAERLRQLTELRRMHPDRERPTRRDRLAPGTRAQRGKQRALRLVQVRLFEHGEAGRGALLGHGGDLE
jgi:hypothetical protein